MKNGIFYASETGNTRNHAFDIVNCFSDYGVIFDAPIDISELKTEVLKEFDFMIFGSPTWNIGELQADLDAMIKDFDTINFSDKITAIYGCGDQEGYTDTYQDAIGILANVLINAKATLIGKTFSKGHNFSFSKALVDEKFLGLALDNHNQPDLSKERIQNWVKQLVKELKNLKKI